MLELILELSTHKSISLVCLIYIQGAVIRRGPNTTHEGIVSLCLTHFHGSGNRKYILQSFAHLLFLQKQDNYFFLFQPSVYELIRQPNFASLPIIVEDFVKDSGATFSGTSLLLTSTLFCGRVENKHLHAHLTQESFHCCADLQSLPAGECLCVGSVL